MPWHAKLAADPTPWLMEPDDAQPGIRYRAMRDQLCPPVDPAELETAREAVMTGGPVSAILGAQYPAGYWVKPGTGYLPKYRGTVWQVIFLAQLGASDADPRVRAAGDYVLDHTRSPLGAFTYDGRSSGHVHCIQGNLLAALLELGWDKRLAVGDSPDPRLVSALDWTARSVTGEGIAPSTERDVPMRYYRSSNSGPGFLCAGNNHLPCAWGAVKVLLALTKVPVSERTPSIQRAIQLSVDFLLSRDPAVADYPTPTGGAPNGSWFKFGFPVGYVTDVLQTLEALTAAGVTHDLRLEHALDFVTRKQDKRGRWPLEYSYEGKTWFAVEEKRQPSKWVTLRALQVLRRAG